MCTTNPSKSTNVIHSATNVLKALRFIAESRTPVNATQVAQHLDVSHSTAFRVVRTLANEGLIDFDSSARTYQVSMNLVALAWNVIDRVEIRDLARPLIREVVRRFGETITLAIPSTGSIVFVDRVEGTANVRFFCDIGRRLPLHAGAAAKAILAYLPEPEFEHYLALPLEKLTPTTKTDPRVLCEERTAIRKNNYSISVDEVDIGVSAVGVPILNSENDVIAAAAIANLTARWDQDDFDARAEAMLALADALNKKCTHLMPKRGAV